MADAEGEEGAEETEAQSQSAPLWRGLSDRRRGRAKRDFNQMGCGAKRFDGLLILLIRYTADLIVFVQLESFLCAPSEQRGFCSTMTKASFAIEREEVTPQRGERFVAQLARSGTGEPEALLDEKRLTALQNLIVDARYAAKGFREDQNYVGQALPGFHEKVHYVCPPPQLVRTLLAGLRAFRRRSEHLPAPVRAAVISFGFVYVHPFGDGNGRLHRLLLHESLAFDGYTEKGTLLPFSAAMLRDPGEYDRVLESVSTVVGARVKHRLEKDGTLVIDNAKESEGVWRYPDLTPHVDYVLDLIATTVTRDLPEELQTLTKLDIVGREIKNVVDLPGKKMNLLLSLLLQNRGKLSGSKRASAFAELADEEVERIEAAFSQEFGRE